MITSPWREPGKGWGYALMSAGKKKKSWQHCVSEQLEDFTLFVVNVENKLS